jgi:hypothetical protein
MAGGKTIYFGSARNVTTYFTSCIYAFPLRENQNPADFAVAIGKYDRVILTSTFVRGCMENVELVNLFVSLRMVGIRTPYIIS